MKFQKLLKYFNFAYRSIGAVVDDDAHHQFITQVVNGFIQTHFNLQLSG
jgi:hypothetical protein